MAHPIELTRTRRNTEPTRAPWTHLAVRAALALGTLAGCNARQVDPFAPDNSPPVAGGGLGIDPATSGSVEQARLMVSQGQLPPPEMFNTEGLLREYDLSDDGPACDHILCSRPALAVAPSLRTGQREYWVQLGLTSLVDHETFRRPPLDVAVAIDRSSSMAIDLVQVYDALAQLTSRLRDDDRLAVVMYNEHAEVLRPLGPVGDADALISQVRAIPASGEAGMPAGMAAASNVLRSASDPAHRLRRLMVFSCSNPSDVAHNAANSAFVRQVTSDAGERLGTSFFGVLTEPSAATNAFLNATRGGAYYALTDLDNVSHAFDHEFETMVTPIAYDVSFGLTLEGGLEATDVFGVSGSLGASHATSFHVATAFIDARRGAVIARIRSTDASAPVPTTVGGVRLAYTPETAVLDEAARTETELLAFPTDLPVDQSYFSSAGVRRGVALVNEAEQVRAALTAFRSGQLDAARALVASLEQYMAGELAATSDHAIDQELQFVRALLRVMDNL